MKKQSLFVSAVAAGFILSLMFSFKSEAYTLSERRCLQYAEFAEIIKRAKDSGFSKDKTLQYFSGVKLDKTQESILYGVYGGVFDKLTPSKLKTLTYKTCVEK